MVPAAERERRPGTLCSVASAANARLILHLVSVSGMRRVNLSSNTFILIPLFNLLVGTKEETFNSTWNLKTDCLYVDQISYHACSEYIHLIYLLTENHLKITFLLARCHGNLHSGEVREVVSGLTALGGPTGER